jgi:hypothetical protein
VVQRDTVSRTPSTGDDSARRPEAAQQDVVRRDTVSRTPGTGDDFRSDRNTPM